ncbi:MAG: protein-L-isoaspartate O-methyltransferase family protein [Allosphingosinicella sp.]|uniref:protein-L-isoaspartate O-methyltransferase family protein n=1 Tax=Allosphingosinicella sp. TaxID=2823234 RepID=UPI0039260FA6
MTEHNFEHMRRAMVASQLRTTGVNDPRVVAAMREVPRERFVPGDKATLAYADALVTLPGGRQLNGPMSTGRLLTEAAPRESDHCLLVGAATGYAAALLSRLTGSVVAVEEDAALVAFAREALAGSGVELIEGPLAEGHAARAPYDLILIDGAVEFVPQAIIDQLAENGRLAGAILDNGVPRLSLGRKAGGAFGTVAFADVATAVLPGFTRPKTFTF